MLALGGTEDLLRIVGIGGGTGLPLLMKGLCREGDPAQVCLTALVCVSDNGGSSGRLREEFQIPAVGDIRNCLLGLSPPGSVLADLLQHRFSGGNGLAGHSLGNLVLSALYQQTGNLGKAIDRLTEALPVSGAVLPVTEVPVTLCAEGRDGRIVKGESEITAARMSIRQLWLEPERPMAAPGVLESLEAADAIVLGPGSLFTSVVPPLLVGGVAEAIRRSRAVRIYVCNLMGEPGETDDFTAADHVKAIEQQLGPGTLDVCVLNTRAPRPRLVQRYRAAGARPVVRDLEAIQSRGVRTVGAALLGAEGPKARHDPSALARLVLELAQARVARRPARVGRETRAMSGS